MRLLTHNTLQSPLTSSYPLKITCTALRHIPSTPLTTDEGPYDFVRNLLENGKIEWDGVTGAREDLKDKIEELAVGDLQVRVEVFDNNKSYLAYFVSKRKHASFGPTRSSRHLNLPLIHLTTRQR